MTLTSVPVGLFPAAQTADPMAACGSLYDANLDGNTTLVIEPDGDYEEGDDMPASAAQLLPGEDAPLSPRRGGLPVTDEQALGTARRMQREHAKRRGVVADLPTELPFAQQSGTSPLLSIRAPKRVVWVAHAKADMEERSVSDVVREALIAYGATPPGYTVAYLPPTTTSPEVGPGYSTPMGADLSEHVAALWPDLSAEQRAQFEAETTEEGIRVLLAKAQAQVETE